MKIIYALIISSCLLIVTTTTALAQSGSLDLTFDTDGKVTTDFLSFEDAGNSIAIQSDGKIVVAGNSYLIPTNAGDFAVTRYNSDGSLDNTFDSDGKVSTDIGSNSTDNAYSVAIQSDGKIVVAGISYIGGYQDFAVVRYNSDGTLDNSFDSDGKVTTAIGATHDYAYSVAIQSDGKIVVAGQSYNVADIDFAVVRYNSDGSLDNTFDTDGKVTTDSGADGDLGYSVAIQSDGKIVVSGQSDIGINRDFAVVRYNSDGSLDNTFDTDGIVTTDIGGSNDIGKSVALQSDGKIVVAGSGMNDFAVARYNSDGSLDNTFDTDGMLSTDVGSIDDAGKSVAIQSDGKIVVAGDSYSSAGGYDFAVVCYNSNGSLDNTFDTDGKVTTAIGSAFDIVFGVALQSDGKIVAAGFSANGANNDFALVRYNNTIVSGLIPIVNQHTEINIYPNPSTGIFQIFVSNPSNEKIQLNVIDVLGKEVYSEKLSPGITNHKIDLSHLPNGIYMLHNNNTSAQKIIIQK